ncbi:MAG: NosD domain-containing protein, partial [Planctomycetota bacterium]
MWIPCLALALAPQTAEAVDLPTVEAVGDDFEVGESCRLVLPGPTPVSPTLDRGEPGVIRVRGDRSREVRVEFSGVLHGAEGDTPPDAYTGVGIHVTGPNVVLVAPRVQGFKVGIEAVDADGLRILDADVSDNYRQRLGSSWEREDPGDWLSPHENDEGQWKQQYGAGLVVERSAGIHIEGLRARDVQNGLLLDRVTDSVITRCDASFLSGWGCALWRSSRNRIDANRFEFCIRGYSHGRYNRGQDSAGLLMFEQCFDNVVYGNSLTHSGDGVFGFAGREALGQTSFSAETYGPGLGCNGNEFAWNDLSFAAAHGLEMTFSFDN